MKHILFFAVSFFTFSNLFAGGACAPNQVEVYFEINVEQWAYEISYDLRDGDNNIIFSGDLVDAQDFETNSVCVDDDVCLILTISDTYGDGINQNNDYYFLVLDGDTIVSEADFNFGHEEIYEFNCPEGATCLDPYPNVDTATVYTTEFDNSWYEFTVPTNGLYQVSTCEMNTCNTQIWIFEDCTGNIYTESEEGSMAYNNDASNCAPQSILNVALEEGVTYLIRIGDFENDCTGSIDWIINFEGEVTGCMDPTMCNYEPLATIAGPCYAFGSTECPEGPDLIIDQDYALNTITLDNLYMDPNSFWDNCQVQEGCVRGMGDRIIVRFATRIANIGEVDYYIGTPTANQDQFDFENCHGHTHYKGYAEYLLYNELGEEIPVGFKAGFCVMDIDCNDGGTGGYNCSNMGISAGCADIYGSGTTCNWIDITDVDTGDYTFVIRTNWDFSPDALGRYETNHLNNWAQICINIGLDNLGEKTFSINPDCPTYTDCNGDPYGSAELDCNGVCGGDALQGDINNDEFQNLADAQTYVSDILAASSSVSNCSDLNADGEVTIFDAALIQDCYYGEFEPDHTHGANGLLNHCEFPYGYTNIGDTVWLTILDYDLENQYIDIGMKNPYNTVLGYEFDMSGLTTTTAENIFPTGIFPVVPETTLGGYKVMALSYEDSLIPKNFAYVPLVRVNYFELTSETVCIENIIDIVSGKYEATITMIENGCIEIENNVTVSIEEMDTICSNVGGVDLNASPNGGYFFGDGVVEEIFYPEMVGEGTHEIFYYFPNQLPVSTFVTVLNADVIVMDDEASLMDTDPSISLSALPAGGTFSGNGLENTNMFNPQIAGVGEHTITYTYEMVNGCMAAKEMVITVNTATAIADIDNQLGVKVQPNPFNDYTTIYFNNDKKYPYTIEIINSVGQVVKVFNDVKEEQLIVYKNELANGVYTYLISGEYYTTGKLVVY